MARSKLKRGKWAQPHDPTQIYISGPTMLVDPGTKIHVGWEYLMPRRFGLVGSGPWTATRILDNRIEFQCQANGNLTKVQKAEAGDIKRIIL